MPDSASSSTAAWPLWRRIVFRFVFLYLLLQIAPWHWFDGYVHIDKATDLLSRINAWAVELANARVFHVRPTLVPVNGSGDTSFAWTELWLYLSVACIGCGTWSLLDRKRAGYARLDYWFRTCVRYYVATFALSYGIIKLFALQMPFPTASLMSTPLGDLLPMRLSWLFIGYSTSYEVFSGVMETVAGLLLLYRRTITIGLIAAAGAFLNVVMINLSYDVPVKLFSSHLFFATLYLLLNDAQRLFRFFVLNRTTEGNSAYEPPSGARWVTPLRLAVKVVLLYVIVVAPFRRAWTNSERMAHLPPARPFRAGVYDVRRFARNGDTLPPLLTDTTRWRDVIFDNAGAGSIGSSDTLFWQRYRRGYFRYKADTLSHTVSVWRTSFTLDSTHLFDIRYEMPDTATVRLWTAIRGDSIFVELARSSRHFQLAERQFHWLSEYNR